MKIAWLKGNGVGPKITFAYRHVPEQVNINFKLGLEFDDTEIELETVKER